MAITPTSTSLVRKKVKLIGLLRDCAKHLETENSPLSKRKTTTSEEVQDPEKFERFS